MHAFNLFRQHTNPGSPEEVCSEYKGVVFNGKRLFQQQGPTHLMSYWIPLMYLNHQVAFRHYDPNLGTKKLFGKYTKESNSNIHKFDMLEANVFSSDEDDDEPEYIQPHIDELSLLNTILPLLRSFDSQLHASFPDTTEEDIGRLNHATSQMEQVGRILNMTNPFQSNIEGLIYAFFYGEKDLCSERMVKKIHYLLKLTLKLQEESTETLVLPVPDRILDFQSGIKSKVPVLSPVECKGTNKPSEYLKNIAATPGMIDQISTLPDFTTGQIMNLNQGDKWKHHENLQTPMMTVNGKDYRIGDIAKDRHGSCWLLNKLLTKEGRTVSGDNAKMAFVESFRFLGSSLGNNELGIMTGLATNFAILSERYLVPLNELVCPIPKDQSFIGNGCTVVYDSNGRLSLVHDGLDHHIACLWSGACPSNGFKRAYPSASHNGARYMKVVISPIILWSDDTSGNKSKQYNVFDSYLMYLGAMSLEQTSHRENTLFVCTPDKNLPAVDMLGPIVDGLAQLERGIEVYSYDHNEYVLLVAPLLFLMADNIRHSQLAMHKGTNSRYPCRKCFCPKHSTLSGLVRSMPNSSDTYISHEYPKEHLAHFRDAVQLKETDIQKYKALSDTYSFIVNHCGSFVGRDYKQLIQGLPTVLGTVFSEQVERFDVFMQCFTYLGQLTSLIYLRGIECSSDIYIHSLQVALSNFTSSLFMLDQHLIGSSGKPPMFSLRPKIHMLHHLVDDIQKFGCPLQYETESSEQFNKFIREHLFQTNRQYTSRDAATRFGKQFICRQLFNGLSFVYTKTWKENGVKKECLVRGKSGSLIQRLQTENVDFNKHFFGARKNQTDSYYISKSQVVDGLTGLFSHGNILLLGKVFRNQDGSFSLQKYSLVTADYDIRSSLPDFCTDSCGNPHIRPCEIIPVDTTLKCKEVMGMETFM